MALPMRTTESVSGSGSAALTAAATNVLHVSGQPCSPVSGEVPADYDSQVLLSLVNLHQALLAAGSSVAGIVRLTLYIVNYNSQREQHHRHLRRFLRSHSPIITPVSVDRLERLEWQFLVNAEAVSSPAISRPVSIIEHKLWDVIIIGAGLSGLTAADQLGRNGLSSLILEARDRVGGRTWSIPVSDGKGVVDLGASWMNDTNQSKVSHLVKHFGLEFVVQNTTGNCLTQDKASNNHVFEYGGLPFDVETQRHLGQLRDMIEADCHQLDIADPRNPMYDSMTFLAYLHSKNASEIAIESASIWTRAMLGQEPHDISALYFLHHCKAGGGLIQMRSDRSGGGQYLRVRQGTQAISTALAASVPAGNILLSSPVTEIDQSTPGRVVVQIPGRAFQASKVISTVPSPVLRTINFNPPLPERKRLLVDSYTYGYFTKAMLIFRNPFWVEKGFCGLAQSFTGPASIIRDCSSSTDDLWVLTCFLCGDTGRAWSHQDESSRIESLLEQVGHLYGDEDRVRREYITTAWHDWSAESYSGFGCPCPSLSPGVLSAAGDVLRSPFRNVHFSGTETSVEWKGFMEGAVRSGELAATEVSRQLIQV